MIPARINDYWMIAKQWFSNSILYGGSFGFPSCHCEGWVLCSIYSPGGNGWGWGGNYVGVFGDLFSEFWFNVLCQGSLCVISGVSYSQEGLPTHWDRGWDSASSTSFCPVHDFSTAAMCSPSCQERKAQVPLYVGSFIHREEEGRRKFMKGLC